MPVQLHQSALWAAYIREHLDGLPSLFNTSFLCGAPDQGDSCIMQKETGVVNHYVVIIFTHYIIVRQGKKKRHSDRIVTVPPGTAGYLAVKAL